MPVTIMQTMNAMRAERPNINAEFILRVAQREFNQIVWCQGRSIVCGLYIRWFRVVPEFGEFGSEQNSIMTVDLNSGRSGSLQRCSGVSGSSGGNRGDLKENLVF